MSPVRLAIVTSCSALLAAFGVAVTGSSAQADPYGGADGGGFNLQAVDVVVRGGANDPIAGGTLSVSVPPSCWWTPLDVGYMMDLHGVDPDEPNAMVKAMRASALAINGSFTVARLGYPSDDYVRGRQGDDWDWYQLRSDSSVNCAETGFVEPGGNVPPGYYPGDEDSTLYPLQFQAFQGAPPPPEVDVEDVVTEVWDAASQEIDGPDLDRTPKATADGFADATLVNVETWFWADNAEESLAGDGEITLEVSIPGSQVAATLTASTDGVQITSPVGAVDCDIDQVTTEYALGAPQTSACTMPFERANINGWPVTATTVWNGEWQGTQADGDQVGGDLETLTPSATSNVPVAESQALVDEVG